MATVIFVHGTGGRKDDYAVTFEIIENKLAELRSEIKLVPCLWGEPLGTKLNADGSSIPNYSEKGGKAGSNNEEDDSIQLWEKLYKDPLYEILLLSLKPTTGRFVLVPPGQMTPSQKVQARFKQLTDSPSEKLLTQLQEVRITTELFNQAVGNIRGSSRYKRLLETGLSPLGEVYSVLARAILAQVIELCDRQNNHTPLRFNQVLRDRIVELIADELSEGTEERGVSTWLKKLKNQLVKGVVNIGDKYYLQRKRGTLTDAAYPFTGDILFYQAKGNTIRDFIRNQVENVEPPVILLAHSLGGIACVDLLIEQQLPQVQLLVTVGSQAPFLYEIDALQSLSYGEPLPEYFPTWLNIYDLRDILSYIGDREKLFPGRIKDVPVDNKQPFPESHGAYWYNSQTWEAILKEIR